MSKGSAKQDIPPRLTWSLDVMGPEFTDADGFLYTFYNVLPHMGLKIHTRDGATAFLKRDMRSDYLEVLEGMLSRLSLIHI